MTLGPRSFNCARDTPQRKTTILPPLPFHTLGFAFVGRVSFPVKVSLKKLSLVSDDLKGRNANEAHSGIRDTWVQILV